MRLTTADHARVSAAVAAAEARTAGEIVTAAAARSDAYHDAALHWAVLAMLGTLAALAARPGWALTLWAVGGDGWSTPPVGAVLLVALVASAVVFLVARLILSWMPLRLALTPGATKARRVRRQALALFRIGAEARTSGRTGVLIYLSLAERRAEIVADAAIHARVAPEAWGAAMAALVAHVREGRVGDGLVATIEQVGALLAEHFPRGGDDVNELPDRLVVL